MANRGRFKGFRTEATVAKMTPEEQKIYRDFVKEVENAQRNNLPLPEPPKFSTDKPEKTENTTGKRRGRKPGSKKINGKMVSAEEYEKIKSGIVNDVVDKAIANNKANKDVEAEDEEDENDDDIIIVDDDDDADSGLSKREQLVAEIVASHTEYQKNHILNSTEEKPWFSTNDSKGDVQETVIHHISREGFCIIETNEIFWIRRIKKMIEKCPDKVIVDKMFTNGDMIRVEVPYAAMKKVMVSTRTMSEEQRQRLSEMGKSRRKNKETEEVEPVEETTTETTTETTSEPVVEGLAGKMVQTLTTTDTTTTDTPTQGFTEVSENDEEEEVEHVEAEIVDTPKHTGYDEEDEEEGEDEFEYEPASLNGGGSGGSDDDEVVFERTYCGGNGLLKFIDTYY